MDDIDITTERSAVFLSATVRALQVEAENIPVGEPGECDLCGEHSMRLVEGACAPLP